MRARRSRGGAGETGDLRCGNSPWPGELPSSLLRLVERVDKLVDECGCLCIIASKGRGTG